MQQIDDCVPSSDRLKWFNCLYMAVTQQVDLQPFGYWKDDFNSFHRALYCLVLTARND